MISSDVSLQVPKSICRPPFFSGVIHLTIYKQKQRGQTFNTEIESDMISRFFCIGFCLFLTTLHTSVFGQDQNTNKPQLQFQFDSRNTFVSGEAVGIFGVRGGLLFNQKFEIGLGAYGSNVLNFLGTEITKDYIDNSLVPAQTVQATIGFEYASLYGEYTVLNNNRWTLTVNSQYGMGRVNIRIPETGGVERLKRENKGLVEHSVKMKYQFNSWLKLIGGFGYRYLLGGEKQIKDAFNAPIYLITGEIDFKKLIQAVKN